MKIIKQAFTLLKKEQRKKETTLQRRLMFFFASVSIFIILSFALLMTLFGITGKEEMAIQSYMDNELSDISSSISDDFGRLSLDGIQLAEELIKRCDDFFSANNIAARELSEHPDLLEPLLTEQIQSLIHTINNRTCGGVFILLDATVNPEADNAELAKAGIFIKKTQPTSTQAVGVKTHYLRGPAQIARDNKIELLGQWRMEYDVAGEEFFTSVMDTAREYPDLPLSRLYFWSGRTILKDNSEAGFLLCVPLRSKDGTVFGVCGIEVSDRMFKSLYSPEVSTYENAFIVAAPSTDTKLRTSEGIIAGNYYLTGNRLTEDLSPKNKRGDFESYESSLTAYAGKSASLRLYPTNSPYENISWSVAILMSENSLQAVTRGSLPYFIGTIVLLLLISLILSIYISRRYLRPVTDALDSIRSQSYEDRNSVIYLEINDLFEFLADRDREHGEELQKREEKLQEHEEKLQILDKEKQDIERHYDRAQTWISHLSGERMPEVDQDSYEMFLQYLHTLTPKEYEIFNLYLEGKSAKEILVIANINQNTLKYHNRNIYSKLGITSRKQLLEYAALMNHK